MKWVMIIVAVGEDTFPGLYNFAQILRPRFIIFAGFLRFLQTLIVDLLYN